MDEEDDGIENRKISCEDCAEQWERQRGGRKVLEQGPASCKIVVTLQEARFHSLKRKAHASPLGQGDKHPIL